MKIDEIKNKILQLAIQGKLVPQDENDEPAAVLLEKIKVEREQLIKERKIKKEKPLTEISEEEKVFELPKGWKWTRLNEVYRFIDYRGKTPNKIDAGVPFITAKNVRMGYIDYAIQEYISPEEYEERKSRGISNKGDILFTTEAPMGYVAIADLNIFSAGQRLITLQQYTKDELLQNRLFMYFIMSPYFQNELMEKKTGTTVYGIKAEKLKSIIVPVPPLEEQKRIVSKVDELFAIVDQLSENKEAMAKCISDTRNKVLQLAIQGKLVTQDVHDEPASVLLERIREEKEKLIKEKKIKKEKPLTEISEEEKVFELPKGWEWVRLGEIVQINPRNNAEDELESSFIPMALISDGYNYAHGTEIRLWRDIKSGFTHFAENDLILAKITPCFENRKSAILHNLKNGIGAGTTELYVLREYANTINIKYLYYIVVSSEFIDGGKATYTGTAGQQRVKKEFVTNYLVGLPPLEEQNRIVAKVNEVMKYLDHIEQAIMA